VIFLQTFLRWSNCAIKIVNFFHVLSCFTIQSSTSPKLPGILAIQVVELVSENLKSKRSEKYLLLQNVRNKILLQIGKALPHCQKNSLMTKRSMLSPRVLKMTELLLKLCKPYLSANKRQKYLMMIVNMDNIHIADPENLSTHS